MKTIKLLPLLILFCCFSLMSYAQRANGDQTYVIQLATYSSWQDFAKHEQNFYTNTGTADNNIYAEKKGNLIKVYLFDSYQGMWAYFYPGDHLNDVLRTVRNNTNFKDAFRRSDVDINDLLYYEDVFRIQNKNKANDADLTAKGGNSISPVRYVIQLGVFENQRTADHIANNYGFSSGEKDRADQLLSYDFTKVDDKVCRRYFFGNYNNRSAAMAKMKELEKNSNRKLLLVKI